MADPRRIAMVLWDAWLFTANPNRYDIFGAVLRDGPLTEFERSMSANWNRVQQGDDFALYISGHGVHLFGVITGAPARRRVTDDLWRRPEDRNKTLWFAHLRTQTSFWGNPITLDEMRDEKGLQRVTGQLSRPSRSPMGLTSSELATIRALRP